MISFISFADSIKNQEAAKRIEHEAKSFNYFSNITIYNENLLDQEFYENHFNFMQKNRRGFGYWIWKPQILIQELNKINFGDSLVYADAGCTLNPKGISRLNEYVELSKKYGIVGFQNGMEERIWTKNDLFILLNYTKFSTQVLTGAYVMTKTEKTIEFAKLWGEICLKDNYRYVNDSKSLSINYILFKEHRHDQSIFSILIRQYVGLILNNEIQLNLNFPIYASRKINK
jgi:hypothetical protein